MKKEQIAKKMKRGIVEGDYSHMGPQDKFSGKDVKKEKKTRKEKVENAYEN